MNGLWALADMCVARQNLHNGLVRMRNMHHVGEPVLLRPGAAVLHQLEELSTTRSCMAVHSPCCHPVHTHVAVDEQRSQLGLAACYGKHV